MHRKSACPTQRTPHWVPCLTRRTSDGTFDSTLADAGLRPVFRDDDSPLLERIHAVKAGHMSDPAVFIVEVRAVRVSGCAHILIAYTELFLQCGLGAWCLLDRQFVLPYGSDHRHRTQLISSYTDRAQFARTWSSVPKTRRRVVCLTPARHVPLQDRGKKERPGADLRR